MPTLLQIGAGKWITISSVRKTSSLDQLAAQKGPNFLKVTVVPKASPSH